MKIGDCCWECGTMRGFHGELEHEFTDMPLILSLEVEVNGHPVEMIAVRKQEMEELLALRWVGDDEEEH